VNHAKAHHHPAVVALAATACFATGMVHAQRAWPATAVTFSVPAAPGGTTIDTVTRRPADTMNE
jgi:tripartite-type tricarboxylate transporter receptor subunit TctC